jgi:hypothetical protein
LLQSLLLLLEPLLVLRPLLLLQLLLHLLLLRLVLALLLLLLALLLLDLLPIRCHGCYSFPAAAAGRVATSGRSEARASGALTILPS